MGGKLLLSIAPSLNLYFWLSFALTDQLTIFFDVTYGTDVIFWPLWKRSPLSGKSVILKMEGISLLGSVADKSISTFTCS